MLFIFVPLRLFILQDLHFYVLKILCLFLVGFLWTISVLFLDIRNIFTVFTLRTDQHSVSQAYILQLKQNTDIFMCCHKAI